MEKCLAEVVLLVVWSVEKVFSVSCLAGGVECGKSV